MTLAAGVLLYSGFGPPPDAGATEPHRHYTIYKTGSRDDKAASSRFALLFQGGGRDSDEAFRWLSGKAAGGDIVVLRTTGGDGYNDYLYKTIGGFNSVCTIVCHDRLAAQSGEVLELVDRAEAIFFAGGDQSRYLKFFGDTALQRHLQEAVTRKAAIGGTSAGLAILGEFAFSAKNGSAISKKVLADPFDRTVQLTGGLLDLPFMSHTITDTHFSQRERLGRLLVFMARLLNDNSNLRLVRGIGVDEATALLVEESGRARLVGANACYFLEATAPQDRMDRKKALTMRGIKAWKMRAGTSGAWFDLKTWKGESVEPLEIDVRKGQVQQQTPKPQSGRHQ